MRVEHQTQDHLSGYRYVREHLVRSPDDMLPLARGDTLVFPRPRSVLTGDGASTTLRCGVWRREPGSWVSCLVS